jgi:hypothetical protein
MKTDSLQTIVRKCLTYRILDPYLAMADTNLSQTFLTQTEKSVGFYILLVQIFCITHYDKLHTNLLYLLEKGLIRNILELNITKDGAYFLVYPFSFELSMREVESYKSQIFREVEKWTQDHHNSPVHHQVYEEFFQLFKKTVAEHHKEYYVAMRERCALFKEELMQQVFHPRRVQHLLETYDYMDL